MGKLMSRPDAPLGQLGNYRVLEELGRGGFSIVYRAENVLLKKIVALKLMLPALFADPQSIQRFIQEARTVARLNHPHITRVFDLDEDQGRLFMAVEYMAGGDLHQWLKTHGNLGFRQIAGLIADIAEALDYAHNQDVVHGDVKPANILLTEDGVAKLSDFGLLKAVESSGVTSADLTRGTPYYISPEQAEGGPATARSDQYALGVVAYELLTGRVPFEGETPITIYLKHVREAPAPAGQLNPLVTPQLEAVLTRALEKDPAKRYPDCSSFGRALREAIAATEAEQFQGLMQKAQAALADHEAPKARPLIEAALQNLIRKLAGPGARRARLPGRRRVCRGRPGTRRGAARRTAAASRPAGTAGEAGPAASAALVDTDRTLEAGIVDRTGSVRGWAVVCCNFY